MAHSYALVIDFGSEKISAILAGRGVNNTFNFKGTAEVEYSGFMEGEFINEGELKLQLQSLLSILADSSKIYPRQVYIGVPAEFCAVVVGQSEVHYKKAKYIKPYDVAEICQKAVINNFEDSHVLINRAPVYFLTGDNRRVLNPVHELTDKLSATVSFVLCNKYFYNLISNILTEIGIEDFQFISSSLAEALYLLDEETRNKYAILIDVGHITSSVALVRGDGLLGLASFSEGGGNITADLSTCLDIKFGQAEVLKRKIILNLNQKDGDIYEIDARGKTLPIQAEKANEIVKARIDQIAKMIQKCIQTFAYEVPSSIQIFLTGGGIASLKGGKDYLSKLLTKDVEIADNVDLTLKKPEFSSILGVLNMALISENAKN